MAELIVSEAVDAEAQQVWDALVDWDRHHEWMLLTRASGGAGVGEAIEAFTGLGPLRVRDTMRIVVWDPPSRAVVRHTGRLVRGNASFEVYDAGPGRSRVVWSEWLDLPFGLLGRLGWSVARPLLRAGVAGSLRRLASLVEASR